MASVRKYLLWRSGCSPAAPAKEGGGKRAGGRQEKRRPCSCSCRSSMSGVFRVPLRESREVREAKLKLEVSQC